MSHRHMWPVDKEIGQLVIFQSLMKKLEIKVNILIRQKMHVGDNFWANDLLNVAARP